MELVSGMALTWNSLRYTYTYFAWIFYATKIEFPHPILERSARIVSYLPGFGVFDCRLWSLGGRCKKHGGSTTAKPGESGGGD